ncbi:MAG: hypothetical protein JEZ14_18525 [Marinilabiliaceae bacterium]|nr:hypothetical protein [Marinilabiliaceae bacterium]
MKIKVKPLGRRVKKQGQMTTVYEIGFHPDGTVIRPYKINLCPQKERPERDFRILA